MLDTVVSTQKPTAATWWQSRGQWIALIVAVFGVALLKAPAPDVANQYVPAARAMLAGRSPYEVAGFYNPPWTLIPFLPVAWMGPRVVSALVRTACAIALAWLAWRLEGRVVTVAALLLSPPALFGLYTGSFDALILYAGFLPTPWALLAWAIKPQLTIGLILYRLYWSWREGQLAADAAPLAVASLLSLLAYGPWPLDVAASTAHLGQAAWDHGLWPWGLIAGLPMLGWAIWQREEGYALAASPFCAPYVSGAGWVGVVLVLARVAPWAVLALDVVLLAAAAIGVYG